MNTETIYRVMFWGDFQGRTLRQTVFVDECKLRQKLTELFDNNCKIILVEVISKDY